MKCVGLGLLFSFTLFSLHSLASSENHRKNLDRKLNAWKQERALALEAESGPAIQQLQKGAITPQSQTNGSWVPDMIVTPDSVLDSNGDPIPEYVVDSLDPATEKQPLVWALDNTGSFSSGYYGRKILLTEGIYEYIMFRPVGSGEHVVSRLGSSADNPVEVVGEAGAIIGTATITDHTIFVDGETLDHTFHYIHWYNVIFHASEASALHIGVDSDIETSIKYTGWYFFGCTVDGLFDHKNQVGLNSKWGFLTYRLDDFRFEFGRVRNMRREHAFYFHNNAGDVTFRYNEIYELGRTAVQIVARIFETVYGPAPVNTGQITFFGNLVADTGLSVLDGCRGGQSFTVTGRNDGFIDIRHNVFAHGYDVFTDGLRDAMEETCDAPIGMGSIVFWTTDAENYGTSGLNIIDKNYAFYHPDAGVRPAFSISASEGSLIARNTIQMGLLFPPQHAIELGKSGGSPSYPAPEQYCVRDNTLINGDFEILGNDAQQPAFDGPLGAQACQ